MTDGAKITDWCRWYQASVPSYKAHALEAVYVNDRALFDAVVQKLDLSLAALMQHMREEPAARQLQTKMRRHEK